MHLTKLLPTVVLCAVAHMGFSQDNNDTNVATHPLNVTIPEVALLDVYDANTGFEATDINFNMADATTSGTNSEAGLYDFGALGYTDLWINYTSVTGAGGSGFDVTRQIDVQMETGSTFPTSFDLRITPEAPVVVANGGTVDSAGTVTAGGVALGATTAIGTNATLVSSIESVYTGDEAQGVRITYALEQNGNFADYQAGLYQATLRYTLSDL
ncbi:hypothetical protein LCGC14_0070410 [marine sediment metagenome]|uniref:WxL domain-containing protein n=1 Tax=marine sediment metagenome TaxID=412755 RepID=A0A0F9YN43_9ZZZZ|nr:hypothetical protein [Maribacter sp.]HDZ05395.1 hypothetical protein [Maribacter sp.]HEA81450.1 hypothetical protein [Maribacter sp.]